MFQLPSYYLHDMLTSMVIEKHSLSVSVSTFAKTMSNVRLVQDAQLLSPTSTQVYSKAVGGPVLRSSSQHMTTISTQLFEAAAAAAGGEHGKTASQRYKTELCRSYHETGLCKYGEKCQFAHGFHEIRSLNRHPKYKTVLCRTYHCTGYCKLLDARMSRHIHLVCS